MNDDTISRQAAIDAFRKELCKEHVYATPFVSLKGCERILNELPSAEQQEMQSSECKYWDDESNFCALYRPSAQTEGWMERNKERILQAGMEGREIEFRIDGRLFAIREKAQ